MNKHLVFTCADRPEYLVETLKSWESVRGLEDWTRTIFVEPTDRLDEVKSLLEDFPPGINIIVNPVRHGVLHNPWVALEHAFSQGADFAVLAEDDLVVSDDVLEYFNRTSGIYTPDEVLGVCAYTEQADGDPVVTNAAMGFAVWIWGLWKESWYNHIRDTWDHNYSTYNGWVGNEAGWDFNINTRIIPSIGKGFVFPEVSHSRHIGLHGTHMQAQWFYQMQPPDFQLHRPSVDWNRVG